MRFVLTLLLAATILSANRVDVCGVFEPHQPEANKRRGSSSGAPRTLYEYLCLPLDAWLSFPPERQTINIYPRLLCVQLVEDCEERLAEDEVTDLLRIVAELL